MKGIDLPSCAREDTQGNVDEETGKICSEILKSKNHVIGEGDKNESTYTVPPLLATPHLLPAPPLRLALAAASSVWLPIAAAWAVPATPPPVC